MEESKVIKKIKFNDGKEYDFSKHPAMQDLSKEDVRSIMLSIKRVKK